MAVVNFVILEVRKAIWLAVVSKVEEWPRTFEVSTRLDIGYLVQGFPVLLTRRSFAEVCFGYSRGWNAFRVGTRY